MSFDPEKVERYSPLSSGGMGSDEMGGFVLYFEYAQLLTLLHEVSSDANPQPETAQVELGEGLPPLDITESDKDAAWDRCDPNHPKYLSPATLRSGFVCRERQLQSALDDARRLQEQLVWIRDHVAEFGKSSNLPVVVSRASRVLAAVTGE